MLFKALHLGCCSCPRSTSVNNPPDFSANKMLWYNIQEYFHLVFMSLQLILTSPLVTSNCFLFLYYCNTYRIDIATQRCSGK